MNIEQGEISLVEFANKYRSLSRYAPEITANNEVNAINFIRAIKPHIKALSRGFSIERERRKTGLQNKQDG
ncbi:hypothetical protein MKX01_001193 [Papaver californicum]|nr:hypothetical protein MKX01_001193 [Papaver californicum]